jgi:hypothetical protein
VTGAIATILIAATVVSTTMAIRALKAEKQANQKAIEEAEARNLADAARLDADNLSRFFARALRRANPEHGGREMTVDEAVKLAIQNLDDEISRYSENELELQENLIGPCTSLGSPMRLSRFRKRPAIFISRISVRSTGGRSFPRSIWHFIFLLIAGWKGGLRRRHVFLSS